MKQKKKNIEYVTSAGIEPTLYESKLYVITIYTMRQCGRYIEKSNNIKLAI